MPPILRPIIPPPIPNINRSRIPATRILAILHPTPDIPFSSPSIASSTPAPPSWSTSPTPKPTTPSIPPNNLINVHIPPRPEIIPHPPPILPKHSPRKRILPQPLFQRTLRVLIRPMRPYTGFWRRVLGVQASDVDVGT